MYIEFHTTRTTYQNECFIGDNKISEKILLISFCQYDSVGVSGMKREDNDEAEHYLAEFWVLNI